ncbi:MULTISPECIES: UvrD-helicase domain-containing protein [Acinetobacter]|mgnify:FL=1|jgi:ATP-dependent DNA helicase Rep|uniref:ATP-dependent DNA helicase Rep n=7 Tax=Gammaproteobacteria TaxID=1236 RepID=F0KFL5_ACIP2|nr:MULTISPECIES: UvrD-helicase domain-containing protein [Acinetobacter]YP_004994417.1 ATP-dependent DNA helicase [Acinetobacter pittii PHEA-2]AMO41481.1 ATP-dependent DNA helicase Rep [Acinetobacter sp. DUT-2]EXS22325.1 uvrD/REP helicase N-terminal domain protein [Acinetobacter baumannii 573719]KCY61158.1 uvrD/REP helicase N-terminal domain protein [Acinetobacter baumannii 1288284]MDR0070835.1 3'-5' exonuclease [Acinetobacter sp. 11520]OBA12899.1 ATP-dependent DNA helicase Rep [Acinetobacter
MSSASQLNNKQEEAMKYTQGPLLVLAGAGSGKTSVITRKIAYLVQHCRIPAHRITAMTFTNKAAREMKERVTKLLSREEAKGLSVSTFHTFGLNLLRLELKNLPLKANFSILDADDCKRILMDLMHRDNLSGAESKELIAKAMKKISDWKNDLILPEQAHSTCETPEDVQFAHLYQLYERNLRAYNAVDFDDLIVMPTRLLQENAEVRDKWQNRVRYLLVDEYQDTNTAQYILVKLLVGVMGQFTAVGDDDQSIYAWRGAKPENMALLKQDFPNLHIIKLEQNYRSTSRILKAANCVIQNNPHIFDKKLWSDKGHGEVIRIITCRNDDDEAERVVKDLLTHKLMNGKNWKDYAVLYRGNFQARVLETQLRQMQIPYKLSGGTSFFARAEIKDVMSYLRLIINPEDDSAFLRIINTPKRAIGPVTLEKLGLFSQENNLSLLGASADQRLSMVLPKKAETQLHEFADFIATFTRELLEDDEPVPKVRQMMNEAGYMDYVREQSATPAQEKSKLDNIENLFTSIQNLINRAEDVDEKNIESVIRKLVLLDLLEQQQEEEDTDKVNLLTLHAAKGLEFPYVYIMGLEEELLPHKNSIAAETIEEERRLMYVGITRARQGLTLTLAEQRKNGGQMKQMTPSRFLDELPQDELEWLGRKKKIAANVDPKEQAQQYLANLKALLKR